MATPVEYMTMALQLAGRGCLTTSPNPMVGCVIVKNGQIIGQGFHQQAGQAHAEVNALRIAGANSEGACAYVTLEPCCHYGRTPPCTQALISAGIKKVFLACLDPNPLMAGKGVEALCAAGIEVEMGLCHDAAQQLNEVFFYYIMHKRPFVIAKWAMSLDGKTMANPSDSRSISGEVANRHTHEFRQQVDAVLVGARTAYHDNPQLTSRIPNAVKQPLRIILSSTGNLPLDLNIFNENLPGKTLVATTEQVDKSWRDALIAKNVDVVILPASNANQVDLTSLLDELGRREIASILVEGGMTVHTAFFSENLVNKTQIYLSPVIIGSLEKKQAVTNLSCCQLGQDFYFVADYIKSE